MKTNKKYLGLIILLMCLVCSIFAQTSDEFKQSQELEKQSLADYKEKNFAEYLAKMERANMLRSNHPRLIYNLSFAYAINKKPKQALQNLERLAKMGLYFAVEKDEDFKSLFVLKEFKSLLQKFDQNNQPINVSSQAFTLPNKDLITEGIAYNPQTKNFFISSVHQRKIVKTSEDGKVTDFSSERDGLWSVLGMKVDEKRQILWATSTAFPQMRGFEKEEDGKAGVFKYDLKSGKLLKKYLLTNETEKHALGDLVLSKNGDVFASDSISPKIYRIDSTKDEIEVFLESDSFSSLQGITFSADEKTLFVADYSKGIFKIEMATKKFTQLDSTENMTLLGIDGLYFYKGNLIAIQNGVNPQRVIKLSLNKKQTAIRKVETLEANHKDFNEPTLGVIVEDKFNFIANSQWAFVNNKGELVEDKLKEPVILRLNL